MVAPFVAILLLALVALVVWAAYQALNPGYPSGRVLAVDSYSHGGGGRGTVGRVPRMHSSRHGLSGTPDELRTTSGGVVFPVEIKSSTGPSQGSSVHSSHRIQLLAYCLLVEETYGIPPPYGLLIYQDGVPREVTWNRSSREEVRVWIDRVRQPYHGEAEPSPAKCSRCPYRRQCDRAA